MTLTLPSDLPDQVSRALREDIGSGDVTARLLPAQTRLAAAVVCREDAILSGRPWAEETFRQVDAALQSRWHFSDGQAVSAGSTLFEIEGRARSLLTAERTALNFLQLLSGVATSTAQFVAAVAGTGCRILDTRKTLPGLRSAQKYAVRCGGGSNHRLGLYDQVLLKENHLAAAGSIAAAVAEARKLAPALQVEVETENLDELRAALDAGADIVMLDDFALDNLRAAVALNRTHPRRALLEASGGANLGTARAIAGTGVDCLSVGALTKHLKAIDLSMRFKS